MNLNILTQLSPEQLFSIKEDVDKELCIRSLQHFVKSLWRYVETEQYIHGKHIDLICNHLQAIREGKINRLLINIPPRCMKSLTVSVFFPAWCWLHNPLLKFLFASYSEALSIRDSVRCRRLIQSPKYQLLLRYKKLDWILTTDQNTKTRFDNSKGGYRIATSVGGMLTGEGGDIIVVDDPHNVIDGESEVIRTSCLQWWDESMSTRLNNPATGCFVLIGQRIHQNDLFGHILERKNHNLTHLNLPMKYEGKNNCISSIGQDWRTEPDELLWPERFSSSYVNELEQSLGAYATASQLQQRPSPRKGGMFEIDKFILINDLPKSNIQYKIRYWDKAGTRGGGCNTAGVLVLKTKEEQFVIADVVKGQWSSSEREKIIRQTAELDGLDTIIWVEQEPGSGGKESAENTIRNLQGYIVRADKVSGSKEVRAEPYASQVGGGNVYLLKRSWNREFIEEHRLFPNGKYKDQVDATAGAINKLIAIKNEIGVW